MTPAQFKPPISPDLLNQIEIRVGTILTGTEVPNSEKLVALEVSFGDHRRTVLDVCDWFPARQKWSIMCQCRNLISKLRETDSGPV
jgi:tRNA-binding EMAP/Myf-like protein